MKSLIRTGIKNVSERLVVYFKGNPNYGTPTMHETLEREIKEIVEQSGFLFVSYESDSPFPPITDAKAFIGFSRGSRYFKKIKGVKIGIGTKFGTYSFINKDDKTSEGDISENSLRSHFTLENKTKKRIKEILKNLK